MRLRQRDTLESPWPLDVSGYHVEVYELQIDVDEWSNLLLYFQMNGFVQPPKGIAVIDNETGRVRIRLASLIEEE